MSENFALSAGRRQSKSSAGAMLGLILLLSIAAAGHKAHAQAVSPEAPATSGTPVEATQAPSIPATPSEASDVPLIPGLPSISSADLPHELSVVGMFLAADIVVKSVMVMLAFASLVTWTIWVAKSLQIAGARARAGHGLKAVSEARTLGNAVSAMSRRKGVVAVMVSTAADELNFSDGAIDHAGDGGVKERVGLALSRIEARAGRHMSRGTGVLATIGSTAPFVGLFGTVWGIMNAFIGISQAQTTNLAVVAPGIAEALLATALGLVAAIPAVVIYNVFARAIAGYRLLLADASAAVERLVSRDIDRRALTGGHGAARAQAAE